MKARARVRAPVPQQPRAVPLPCPHCRELTSEEWAYAQTRPTGTPLCPGHREENEKWRERMEAEAELERLMAKGNA